ncbi:hypothetical protein ABEF92_000173 [Exophiala dermatitidis]|uniref:CENP-T/Histone H4 histone fold domain-containing protein n=1 Tax=Exophiala dermatitidis (strain ATCC 34100 / CBS 525.76 / NIH/UT8656) TaxID=858893 RepID=H6BJV2_EXODN|nr:uncharacterized protein HMPREF1120_00536 [Exophiala dermatitidis NIH/UT8656]EHY52322.1 hypothetical protein HMPREF1120_00536 [Exophiala dermatitidis NIH/UT8656]
MADAGDETDWEDESDSESENETEHQGGSNVDLDILRGRMDGNIMAAMSHHAHLIAGSVFPLALIKRLAESAMMVHFNRKYRIHKEALRVLRHGIEFHIIQMLAATGILAQHARRSTIRLDDMILAAFLLNRARDDADDE